MKKRAKMAILLGTTLLFLSGCGISVDLKEEEDRNQVTDEELMVVEQSVKAMKGVTDFRINHDQGNLYAVLYVEDKAKAKKLAEKAFRLMWAETSGSVDLFVMKDGNEDEILMEAFKPANSDLDNKWIMSI